MKKILFFTLATLLLVNSCKKEDKEGSAASKDEAAEFVGTALSSDGGGATAFIETTAAYSASSNTQLRIASNSVKLKDTSFVDTISTNVPARTFMYHWTYNSDLFFITGTILPNYITSSHTYDGKFDGPYIKSEHQGSGSSTFTELGALNSQQQYILNANWKMNGTYDRTGIITRKISGKVINTNTHLTLVNVLVNRTTKKIVSGTGTLTLTGSSPNLENFAYSGSITFEGNGIATLVVGDKSFTVTLSSGDVVAK